MGRKTCAHCELFFPLQSPWKPPGRESLKNGEKIQNPPPRSNPRKWGKITEKLQKILRKYIFCNFPVIFPHFRGLDRGGGFCNFCVVYLERWTVRNGGQGRMSKLGRCMLLCYRRSLSFALWPLSQIGNHISHMHSIHRSRGRSLPPWHSSFESMWCVVYKEKDKIGRT